MDTYVGTIGDARHDARVRSVDALPFTGPHADLLAAARDILCAAALERGVSISLSSDWGELLELNRRNVDTWLPLMHQPACEDAFWLGAATGDGRVIATWGGVLMDCSARSFGERLSDLSFFYRQPEKEAEPGEQCFCASDRAFETRGLVVYMTAGWTHPDARGRGLFHLLGRLVRLISWDRWDPHWWAGMVADDLAPMWSDENAGPHALERRPTIRYQHPSAGYTYPPLRFIRFSRPGMHLAAKQVVQAG